MCKCVCFFCRTWRSCFYLKLTSLNKEKSGWEKTGGQVKELQTTNEQRQMVQQTETERQVGKGQRTTRTQINILRFFSADGGPVTCCKWGREESEWYVEDGGLDYSSAGGLSGGTVKGPRRGKDRRRGHHRRTGNVGKHEGHFEALQMAAARVHTRWIST